MKTKDLIEFTRPEIRALHLTWIAFFLCFYTWFNMAPLATTMVKSVGWLTVEHIKLFAICNVALTIPARVLVGMAMDRWGPRRVFSIMMIVMAFPGLLFAFGDTFVQLLISRLILGCIGASFVVGIHMTSLWFKPKEIGFAGGFYAGWGNFGASAVAMTLPSIAFFVFGGETGWRYAMASNSILLLIYGVYYQFAITDGPIGSVFRKPRKVVAMEVSSWSDMMKLILWTIPMIGVLAVLVWKIERSGYLGGMGSKLAYALVVIGVIYQVVQVLKINLPILREGVPEDDRYSFNSVAALNTTYMANFGAGLAVVSMLPSFFELSFTLSPAKAGLIASSFAFVNLFARPLGGVLSDRLKSRKQVMVLYMFGIAIGFFLMGFINSAWPITLAVLITVLCSCFVQGAGGATFAIIPLIKRRLTGQISGMVGAYGNVGAVIFLTIYSFVNAQTFFFVVASSAFVSFLFCCRYLKEPEGAFSGEYQLSSVDREIEGEAILGDLFDTPEFEDADLIEGQVKMEVKSKH
ncbi:MAG: MFS transporter [Nitrospiria bacterium]